MSELRSQAAVVARVRRKKRSRCGGVTTRPEATPHRDTRWMLLPGVARPTPPNALVSRVPSSTGTCGPPTRLLSDWIKFQLEAEMDTVLFTDHDIVVFAIAASAIALMLSVLGLTTTQQTRSDINHQLKGLP